MKTKTDNDTMAGHVVLVRDNRAGIHVGTLDSFDPATKTARMSKVRKVWSWRGAASCHGIAAKGLMHDGSRVCPEVELVISTDVVEIVLCSQEGAKSVMSAPAWSP